MTEGWVDLLNATKEHYVRDGRSLCNRWLYLGTTFYAVTSNACVSCRRALDREEAKR